MVLLLVLVFRNMMNPPIPSLNVQITIEYQFKTAHQFIKCNSVMSAVLLSLGGYNFRSYKDIYLVIQLIIYYAINMKYILVTNILINKMGRNLSGQVFIGVFYAEKISAIIIILRLFVKLFLWDGVNGGLMRLYFNFRHITTVFLLHIHNQYSWI